MERRGRKSRLAVGIAGAKALRQEHIWQSPGTARRQVSQELTCEGQMKGKEGGAVTGAMQGLGDQEEPQWVWSREEMESRVNTGS